MNIMFFSHEKEYGGSSRALVTLIEEINKNNNIYVVVPFSNAKIISELKRLNVKIIIAFYSWWEIPENTSMIRRVLFRFAYLYNNIAEKIIIKKIKKYNIDIIHSNTSVIDIGCKIANKLKIPHIWHFREFMDNNLRFIKSEKKSYEFINKYGGTIIYISSAIKEYYSKRIYKNETKLIYDGVSNSLAIMNRKYNNNPKKIKFMIVGTLQHNKGQHLALEAISELKENGYTNMKLYLVGGDPFLYSKYLDSLIQKYKIKDYVEYRGFEKNIKSLRKEIDVELMCSENEAFGLVTVEGMMAGNLIIGSNSGATKEIIIDNKNGLLYNCNNPHDLANKMKFVLENPTSISKIGKEAQRYATTTFSSKKNAESIVKEYERIIKR